MKQHRQDVIRLIGVYQDFAAEWAAEALTARQICLDIDANPGRRPAQHKGSYVAMANDAAFRAASWSASARELFDELLERDAAGSWLEDM